MGDSVPPPSRPPAEIAGRREEDKVLKNLPKVRIPDLGPDCTGNDEPEIDNVVSILKARANRAMRATDKSMHDIHGTDGQRRGGLKKHKPQERSLNPYLDHDLSEDRNINRLDSIIGGVRRSIDPMKLNNKLHVARHKGSERFMRLAMALEEQESFSPDIDYADFENAISELIAFANENRELLKETEVAADELFHPVGKILLRTIPRQFLRRIINDDRIISLVRLLKDDATKRRIKGVFEGFLAGHPYKPRGKYS